MNGNIDPESMELRTLGTIDITAAWVLAAGVLTTSSVDPSFQTSDILTISGIQRYGIVRFVSFIGITASSIITITSNPPSDKNRIRIPIFMTIPYFTIVALGWYCHKYPFRQ